jgi:hypothetical protein
MFSRGGWVGFQVGMLEECEATRVSTQPLESGNGPLLVTAAAAVSG